MNPLDIVINLLVLILSISVHEAAHAWAAHKLGDDTAYDEGRVTLNPTSHVDPIGTVIIPIFNMISNGWSLIGWGKPCPVNIHNFPLKHWRRDSTLVTLAGPASNVILAFIALVIYRFLDPDNSFASLCWYFASLNCCLCVFNLIPIPPLDGSWILLHLLRLPVEFILKGSMFGVAALFILINIPAFRQLINVMRAFLLHQLHSLIMF